MCACEKGRNVGRKRPCPTLEQAGRCVFTRGERGWWYGRAGLPAGSQEGCLSWQVGRHGRKVKNACHWKDEEMPAMEGGEGGGREGGKCCVGMVGHKENQPPSLYVPTATWHWEVESICLLLLP